jgi:hypothetical protein
MRTLLTRSLLISLVTTSALLTARGTPQSVVRTSIATTQSLLFQDGFVIGQTLVGPKTLTSSLAELVDLTAGKASLDAYRRYGGDFSKYWQAIEKQRAGKTFEALWAYKENERLDKLGRQERWVVTAAEGAPHSAADLVLIDGERRVFGQSQFKLGWKAARDAISDAKYTGMSIVTTQESLDVIEKELSKAVITSTRRGVPLPENWRLVQETLAKGRLVRSSTTGAPPLTTEEILGVARATAGRRWLVLADQEPALAGISVALPQKLRSLTKAGKAIGKVLIVADVAATAVWTYQDVQRYNCGEMGANYLAFKAGVRGSGLALTYYAVTSPEPTTKIVAAALALALVTVDSVSDSIYEARMGAARQLLDSIQLSERYHSARRQLLHESRLLMSPDGSTGN